MRGIARAGVVVVVVLGLAIAGCGGSGDKETTASTVARSIPPPTTPSQQQLAKRPGLRDVKRRLRRAGLFPVEVDLGLDHTGAIEVRHVDAIDFRTQAAINKYKAFLANFFRAKPDGFTSRTFGKRLYWTGDEQPLTAAQLRNFRRIVRIGQGQGGS
jgi:hypothetical protein